MNILVSMTRCVLVLFLSIWAMGRVSAQYKEIFWLHGLNGGSFSYREGKQYYSNWWNKEANYPNTGGFSAINISNDDLVVEHTYSIGVSGYAKDVLPKIQSNDDGDRSDNIAVAHSMGGLASRYLDVEQPVKPFRGIITVGSPLNGAMSIASLYNGDMDNLIYNSYVRLTDPLFYGLMIDGMIYGAVFTTPVKASFSVIMDKILTKMITSVQTTNFLAKPNVTWASGAGHLITNYVMRNEIFGGETPQGLTYQEMVPGGDYQDMGTIRIPYTTYECRWVWWPFYRRCVSKLNYHTQKITKNRQDIATPTYKINISGNESPSQLLNLMQTTSPNWYDLLIGVKDVTAVTRWMIFLPMTALYSAKCYNYYANGGIDVDHAKAVGALEWRREHRLEKIPQRLMNCFTSQTRSWSRHCGIFSFICGLVEDIINTVICTFRTIFVEMFVGYDVPVIRDNDGIVTRTSALAQRQEGANRDLRPKYAWSGVDVDADGVNHMEMNGHPEMGLKLKNIFDGSSDQISDPVMKDFFKLSK